MRISVVIPSRNTRDMTLVALRSLHEQTSVPDEIVVVDDGSADGTLGAVAESFPNVRQVPISDSVGFTRAVNRGVAATDGDIIWLLNSDTVVDAGAAELLVSSFEEDPNLGVAGAALFYPDGTPQWSGGRFPTTGWIRAQASGLPALLGHIRVWRYLKPTSGTSSAEVDWVPGAAMAIRREVWQQAGPLRESYHLYCQDIDLCWRAKRAGWDVRVLPDVRVVHAHGGTIRLDADAVGSMRLDQLWPDLIRFRRMTQGEAAGLRARRAILRGGWARVWARRLLTPLLRPSIRPGWRADTVVIAAALRSFTERVDSGRSI